MDGQTLDRFIDPAPYTMLAVSITTCSFFCFFIYPSQSAVVQAAVSNQCRDTFPSPPSSSPATRGYGYSIMSNLKPCVCQPVDKAVHYKHPDA